MKIGGAYAKKEKRRLPTINERCSIFNAYIHDKWSVEQISTYYNLTFKAVEVVLFTSNPNNSKKEIIPAIGFIPKTAYYEPVKQNDGSFLSVEEQMLSTPFYNALELKDDELEIYKKKIN